LENINKNNKNINYNNSINNDCLTNFIFFLSKPYYNRNEVFIMISAIFFLIILYGNVIDFLFELNRLPHDYLTLRMYTNWLYLICGVCITCYGRIIQNEEIEIINDKINALLEE
jgi:hypothetical protein